MPVVSDPEQPERRTLVDANGIPLARYVHVERGGNRVADRVELHVPIERAVPALLSELRGFRIAGDEPLGRALLAADAIPARHSHVYRHDLHAERPDAEPPPGLSFAPVDGRDLLPTYLAAFHPGHPDRMDSEAAGRHLAGIVAGKLGPLLASSALALDADGALAGAILIARTPDEGPFVMELFRDPRRRGAGRALLQRALARAEGPALSLTVTHGNPALQLYERLGFRRVYTAFSVDL